jgi:hypothetical protein
MLRFHSLIISLQNVKNPTIVFPSKNESGFRYHYRDKAACPPQTKSLIRSLVIRKTGMHYRAIPNFTRRLGIAGRGVFDQVTYYRCVYTLSLGQLISKP